MSELLKTIKADFTSARKARDVTKAAFLSGLLGSVEQSLFTAEGKIEATDELVVATVKSFLKKNAELLSIEKISEESRKFVEAERDILEQYLPKQLTEDEIRRVFSELDHSLGLMMKHLKENFAGLYDGALASKVAKEFL